MAKLKELAQAYEAKTTKNIAELERVSVNVEMEERTFKEGTPEEFTVDVALINGEEYRVPGSVLFSLKEYLTDIPDLKHFKVKKAGEGINTRYTVIPLRD